MGKKILALLLCAAMMVGVTPAYSDMATVSAAGNIVPGGSLALNEAKNIKVAAASDGLNYTSFSFKTSARKSYYGVKVAKDSGSMGMSPNWYLTKDSADGAKIASGASLDEWADFGSTLGNNKLLEVDTTYYFCIEAHASKDFAASVTLVECIDQEGDTGDLADVIVPGKTKSGALENRFDVDVFYLDAKDKYTVEFKGEKKLDIVVFNDAELKDGIYHTTDDHISKDVGDSIVSGKRYYLVVSYSGESSSDPKGTPIGYEVTFTGSGTGSEPSVSTGTTSGKKSSTNYLKKVTKSKYMLTNMTSDVSYKIKGKKLIVKKYSGGYLAKKSGYKNGIFTKAKEITKKTTKYKLAKNCKIVYGGNESGTDDQVKTRKWFNSAFKGHGASGSYNVNVCLNKKNQVTLIYISYWDIGAEQM